MTSPEAPIPHDDQQNGNDIIIDIPQMIEKFGNRQILGHLPLGRPANYCADIARGFPPDAVLAVTTALEFGVAANFIRLGLLGILEGAAYKIPHEKVTPAALGISMLCLMTSLVYENLTIRKKGYSANIVSDLVQQITKSPEFATFAGTVVSFVNPMDLAGLALLLDEDTRYHGSLMLLARTAEGLAAGGGFNFLIQNGNFEEVYKNYLRPFLKKSKRAALKIKEKIKKGSGNEGL